MVVELWLGLTGQIDWRCLAQLSDDAVPAIGELPKPYRSCALADRVPALPVDCSAVPSS